MHSLGDVWHPGSGVPYFAGWFPVSQVLQVLQPLGAHSLTFFPILMHSLGDVWHPGSGVSCFAGFAAFGGSPSHFLPYLNAFLRWRLASWLWGSLFGRLVPCFAGFAGFAAFGGPTVSLSSLFFSILMHSLGDVWHPGSGVSCFAGFAAFGGSPSHFLPYLNAFLRWRLASWLWGSLFRRLAPCFAGFAGFAAFGGSQSHFLPYLNAFLRWRLASWLWGSLFRRFCKFCSLWWLTVSLSSLS